MRVENIVRQLERALERLTWDPDQQLEFISRLGVGPDELALEFDDSFRIASGMADQSMLPSSVMEILRPIDDILAGMTNSGPAEWTTRAVSESQTWVSLRDAAQVSLESLRRTDFNM